MIPHNDSPARAFGDAITAWLNLLAAGRLAEACGQLDGPNSYGTRWTPEAIRGVLLETFPPESTFGRSHPEGPMFTRPAGAPEMFVYETNDGGFAVDHPVHLNGEWSDLTAQFEFRPSASGWAMLLDDLHVL